MADPTQSSKERLESEKLISDAIKEQTKSINGLTESIKALLDLQKDIVVQAEKNLDAAKKQQELAAERLKTAQTEYEKVIATYEVKQSEIEVLEKSLDLSIQQRREKEKNNSLSKEEREKMIAEEKKQDEEIKKRKKAQEEYREKNRDIIEQEEKKLELLQQQNEKKEKSNEVLKGGLKTLGNTIASSIGLGDVWSNIGEKMSFSDAIFLKLLSSAGELFSTVMDANSQFAATTGQIADRSINFGYGASQFGIGFEKMHQAQMQLYTSMSGFSNQSRATQESLTMTAAKMELLGVSAAATGQNLDYLTRAFGMNAERAGQVQEEIARHAMAAGIPPQKMAEDFGKYASQMSVYGQQGVDVFIKMEKASKSLGVSMETLNSLIGESMDTFEGSARAAGKLNSVLGGNYLNSLELINANEADRLVIIKKSIEASGVNFAQMDKFQQKAIANALGIKDVAEANKMLSKSSAELSMDMNKQAASQKKLEEVQREAAKVQDQMKVIFEQLLIAVRPFVELIKFLVNVIGIVADSFGGWTGRIIAFTFVIYKLVGAFKSLEIAAKLQQVAAGIGSAVAYMQNSFASLRSGALAAKAAMVMDRISAGFGAAASFIGSNLKNLTGIFKTQEIASKASAFWTKIFGTTIAETAAETAGAGPLVAAGGTAAAEGMTATGTAAAASWQLILAFGAAVALVGAGIWLAANGVAALVQSFAGLEGEQLYVAAAAITLFGIAVIGLMIGLGVLAYSGLGPAAVAIMLGFGAAVMMVGLGIGLMAAGLALLVASIGYLAKSVGKDAAENIAMLSASLLTLGASLGFLLLIGGMFGPVGLFVLGAIFLSLSAAVNILTASISDKDTDKLNAFGNAMMNLAKVIQISGLKSAATEVATAIATMNEQLEKVPEGKTVSFGVAMSSLGTTFGQIKTIEVEKINSAKEFVTSAKEYYEAQSQSKDAKDDSLVEALSKVLGGQKGEEGKEGSGASIILQVDGTKLAKVLLPYLKSQKVDPTIIQSGV